MIQESTTSNIHTPVTASNFSIEINESMFQMLTSRFYNDTISAPIREWSTNAIDACLAASLPVKFDVHIPTVMEPHFSVRDYGTGLSKEDILGLFSTLGASTKRNSNAYNGTFGIGRMSGLAYGSSFSVESYCDGTYHSYLISIQDGIPVAVHLADSTTNETNGLKLSLNVEPADISSFYAKAKALYRYFGDKPSLNIPMDIELDTNGFISDDWFINKGSRDNMVLMSNVAYRIPNDSQLHDKNFSGLVIKAETGQVGINPGRESLSLDKPTITFINTRFKEIEAEYIELAKDIIDGADTFIDKLKSYASLYQAAPYNMQGKIKFPIDALSTPLDDIITTRWSSLYMGNTSKDFVLKRTTKYSEKTVDLSKDSMPPKDFANAKFLLVDISKGYLSIAQALKKEYGKDIILVLRPTGTKVDEFSAGEALLDAMGVDDYDLASENLDKLPEKEKAEARTAAIYGCPIYGDSAGASQKVDTTQKHWYIPVLGSKPLVDDLPTIFKAYNMLPSTRPQFVGIQKKYMAAAEANANFVPILDELQTELDKHVFTTISHDYVCSHLTHSAIPPVAPADIKQYFQEYEQKRAVIKGRTYDYDDIKALQSMFTINTKAYKFTNTFKELCKKYPLLHQMQRWGSSQDEFNYYMKLEHENEQYRLHTDG